MRDGNVGESVGCRWRQSFVWSRWAFSYWTGISLPGTGVRDKFNSFVLLLQLSSMLLFTMTVAAFRSLFMTAAAISPSSLIPST